MYPSFGMEKEDLLLACVKVPSRYLVTYIESVMKILIRIPTAKPTRKHRDKSRYSRKTKHNERVVSRHQDYSNT